MAQNCDQMGLLILLLSTAAHMCHNTHKLQVSSCKAVCPSETSQKYAEKWLSPGTSSSMEERKADHQSATLLLWEGMNEGWERWTVIPAQVPHRP